MKKTVLFIYALLISLTFYPLEGSDLHCIIIADTQAAGIKSSVKGDLNNIRTQIKKISYYTGMEVKEKIFQGDEVTDSLMTWINNYEVGSEDLVMLFFSGHGYRTEGKGDNFWPNLYLTPLRQGVDYADIFQSILEKNPRFFIAIADCCNNVINEKYAPPEFMQARFFHLFNLDAVENYRRLFLYSSGFVIASSASPGQYAWGGKSGGLFTVAFFNSIEAEAKGPYPPDWRVILERASVAVIEKKSNQIPQYEINVN